MSIRLITFDLDDTFWETTPAIQSAETALRDWLAAHAPRLGDFPIEALGAIRRMLVEQEPALRHRISELRRRILQHALQDAGYPADEANGLASRRSRCSSMLVTRCRSSPTCNPPWSSWPITTPSA